MMLGFRTWTARIAGAVALATALPGAAMAQTANSTLGNVVASFAGDVWKPFWTLLLAIGFMAGLWFVATGLARLRDAGSGHDRGAATDGIMRIVGGALLVGLPDTVNAGIGSFYASVMGYSDGSASVGGVSDCMGSSGTGSALTCVAQNVAQNLVPVFVQVSFCLMYLVGAAMILHALYTLATSHSTGRRDIPKGWVARIVIGALICNVPHLIEGMETTLGIQNGTIMTSGFDRSSSLLSYTPDASVTILAQYSTLIGYLFQILVMFGVIAVWRGIVYLRAFADGAERGGMGPGITHVVGGVMLANMKWTVCVVMNTLVGASVGFCS